MIQSLGSNNIFNSCKNDARDKVSLENADSCIKLEKLKTKKFNSNYGTYDYSTKNSSKDGLDYTFLSHRSRISDDKMKNSSKDYIYDLSNTWELNLEFFNNLCKAYTLSNPGFQEIPEFVKKLKNLFNKKNEKRENLINFRGKVLIERQIIEEFRRKIEENAETFREQIIETEENVDNKEEYIKIFEKKLKEVEIYVQKHTKNLVNTKYDIYKSFKMNDFINENTELFKKKETNETDNQGLKTQIEEIRFENKNLASIRINSTGINNTNNIDISFRNNNQNVSNNMISDKSKELNTSSSLNRKNSNKNQKYENSQVGILMKQYNNQIKIIESRNKLLRANLNSLKLKFSGENIIKRYIEKIKKENKQREKNKIENTYDGNLQISVIGANENNITCIEKSNINMDLTRKLATFMDFSMVLNKKDETNYNDFLVNKTTDIFGNTEKQIWDVSCIEKN